MQFSEYSHRQKLLLFFIIKGFLLYILWFCVYDLWLKDHSSIDQIANNNLAYFSGYLMNIFNSSINSFDDDIYFNHSKVLGIGRGCNGLVLYALFAGFIVAFPGKILSKIVFIPLGISIIYISNIIRICLLTYIRLNYAVSFDFNHKYTFTFIVYGIIFLLWRYWTKKYSEIKD